MQEVSSNKNQAPVSAQPRLEDWSFGLPVLSPVAQRKVLWGGTCVILAWSLALHLYDLGGALTLDTVNWWFPYTSKFWNAVEQRNWAKTFVIPHPGVLPMWLAGASMKLDGVFASAPNPDNIAAFKLPLVAINAILPAAIFLVAAKRLGESGLWLAFTIGALSASEPFMVSHGRLFYMDVPFASWSALAIWLCAVTLKTGRFRWCIAAGVALGVAASMRVLPALTVFAGVGIWFGAHFLASRGRDRRLIGFLLVLGAVTLVALAVMWPSFLFEPLHTVERLYAITSKITKQGHRTFFMGVTSKGIDPGVAFYLATLLVKTSPETLACALLGLFLTLRRPALRPLSLGLISAYLPYLGAIAWSNKKVGRYLLDAYPVLLFFAAVGMVWIAGTLVRGLLRAHVHKRTAVVLVAVLAISLGSARTLRLTAFMPHLAAWCADYPGLPCDRLIAFRPFIGLRDTAQWIASQEPNRRPKVYVTYFWRTRDPMPWLDYAIMRRPQDAEYVVVINSVLRRGYRNGFVSALEKGAKPVYRFRLGDREFVRVYRTPFGLRPES